MSSSYVCCVLTILSTFLVTVEVKGISELSFYEGFPSNIPCSKALPLRRGPKPSYGIFVECNITKNNRDIFTINMTWPQIGIKGFDFIADDVWNGSSITVSAEWNGRTHAREYVINVKLPISSTCNSTATRRYSTEIGKSRTFDCPIERNMRKDFNEDGQKEFQVTWYRDCVAISTKDTKYSYGKWVPLRDSGLYTSFNTLKILNPFLYDDGAVFKCVAKYGNSSFEANRLSLVVKRPKGKTIEPELVNGSPKYVVSRESTVNITCSLRYMHIGIVPVIWSKGDSRICGNDDWPCSRVKTPAKDDTSFDLMTSTLTLSNVRESDTGKYTCTILGMKGDLSSNITVTLLPERKVSMVTIAIATVLAVLSLIMLIIIIYFWKRVDILYFYKKVFAKYVETEKPMTYLIYGDDSYIMDHDRNPVNDVTNWLMTRGVAFCDQSKGKEWSDTGAPIADRSIVLLNQCLSLTIFLTPSLLNDNTLELFKSYSGFEENIRRKNFPIVFVCTKDFEKRIAKLAHNCEGIDDDDLKAGNSQETYCTFMKFMRRNIVIHWFPQNNVKFYRSLYVALPKVVERKRMSIDEA